MAQREVNYTSTSVFKKDLPLITELKNYAKKEFQRTVSAQLVCSFAFELARDIVEREPEKFKAFIDKNTADPRVEFAKKLVAELKAEGKWTEDK